MATIVSIETDEKKFVCTVTLFVFDGIVPGHTQFLRRRITKIVMVVGNNDIDSTTEEPEPNVQDGSHLGETR